MVVTGGHYQKKVWSQLKYYAICVFSFRLGGGAGMGGGGDILAAETPVSKWGIRADISILLELILTAMK